MTAKGTITITPVSTGGDFNDFLANYFTSAAAFKFYGGTDYLGTTLISGEQIVFSIGDKLLILQASEGELKYNPTASHTLSGTATTVILANKGSATVDETTGLLTGYETLATIDGVSISGTAGDATSLLQQTFTGLRAGNMSVLTNEIRNYAAIFNGAAGDDITRGYGFDDIIDGGEGADTIVYTGKRENYDIVHNADGTFTVTDLRLATELNQGKDTVKNVETFQFSDGAVDAADAAGAGVKQIVIDASGATAGMDFEAFIRGGFIPAGAARTMPVFDNGGTFSGKEMFIGYGADAASKYVFAHGNLQYAFSTHTVAGLMNTIEYGTRGSGSFDSNGYFVGGNAELRITGLDLSNPVPGNATEEAEIELNGAVHNFAVAYMAGAAADVTRLNTYANALDAYAQHFIGSAFNDVYAGTSHDDTIEGGGGDDVFIASGGDDIVDGGADNDRIYFSGGIANYTLTKLASGDVTVVDTRTGAVSTLKNMESARFGDRKVDLATMEESVLNAAPENLQLIGHTVTENAVAGTPVGELSATDPEGAAVSFSLSDDAGGLFEIVNNQLLVKGPIDYEKAKTLSITVVAKDADGEQSSKTFAITVNDVNEAPTALTLSKTSISENAAIGARIGTVSSVDPEGQQVSLSLASNPGKLFKLVGDKLVLAKSLNYDKAQSHTVTLQAKDAHGQISTQQITINVIDVAKTTLGTDGNDVLNGKAGVEIFKGGAGRDKLYGGAGGDKLYGGADADTFIFKSIKDSTVASSGRDTIYDFSRKQGDKIDLRTIDANTTASGNQAFKFIAKKDFSLNAGELRYEKIKGGLIVHGDVNGDGVADFSIHLKSIASLAKGDFYL
ncbi:cadherin domain-containing protein [Microvirga flavescens]|uniref:cadherin domain-containing protein n=1 Tax=Microvirga flavescens TaxID=2249811 RepID=UPI0018E0A939|nr:cadherin domain-containing protein [Microvirga flavescens]